jgi:hypothetical protein
MILLSTTVALDGLSWFSFGSGVYTGFVLLAALSRSSGEISYFKRTSVFGLNVVDHPIG